VSNESIGFVVLDLDSDIVKDLDIRPGRVLELSSVDLDCAAAGRWDDSAFSMHLGRDSQELHDLG
jgi:hypothetical protein